jgi:hypothetical protein
MLPPLRFVSLAISVIVAASPALADPPVGTDGDEQPAPPPSSAAVQAGAFLPFTAPARGDTQRAYAWVQGGYDSAQGGVVFDSTAQAALVGPVSLRAGVGYVGPNGAVRPSVSLTVDALRQERHGVDLAVYAGYQGQGFNTVPAANVLVAVGRSFGRVNLLANVGYGYGLDEGEHFGEARLAALVRVTPTFRLGLDSRARLDLERDADEPENEPDWDLVAGPEATLSIDRFVLSAGGGLSAIQYRLSSDVRVGAQGHLSFGATF